MNHGGLLCKQTATQINRQTSGGITWVCSVCCVIVIVVVCSHVPCRGVELHIITHNTTNHINTRDKNVNKTTTTNNNNNNTNHTMILLITITIAPPRRPWGPSGSRRPGAARAGLVCWI